MARQLSEDQSMQMLRVYTSLWELNMAEFFWHINVAGTSFKGNHDLFEQLYTETQGHIHVLGEWMQRHGQPPSYHVDHLNDLGQLRSLLPDQRDDAMISVDQVLSEALDLKARVVEEGVSLIGQFGEDATTEDVAIEITRGQEEHLYLLQQANAELVDEG